MSEVVVRRRQLSDLAELAEVLIRVHARDGYPVEGVDDPDTSELLTAIKAAYAVLRAAQAQVSAEKGLQMAEADVLRGWLALNDRRPMPT